MCCNFIVNHFNSAITMFRHHLIIFCIVFTTSFIFFSCTTSDLYEKTMAIPAQQWETSFTPEFSFTIKDTSTLYQVYFVLRHTEKYNYNNIWINLYSQPPGDTLHKAPYELQLATNEKGWLATGMNDIYEHRLKLTRPIQLNTGEYKLKLENIMREDPLQHVLNVGIRVEKVK